MAKTITKLETIRRKNGLSQNDLAVKSGVPFTALREYEQGRRSINNAHLVTGIALADALGVSVKDLVEDVE